MTRRRRRRLLRRIGWNALGLFVFVVMAFPVYWMVATSFKQGNDVLSYEPVWFPRDPTLASYRDAISRPHFWDGVRNSLIVVSAVVVASVVLAFLAALALAKFRFYGRRAFIVVIFAVQMVPLTALIIPLYIALSSVHQTDKLTGVIVSYVALVLPFCVTDLTRVRREIDVQSGFHRRAAEVIRRAPPHSNRRRSPEPDCPGTCAWAAWCRRTRSRYRSDCWQARAA